MLRTLKILSVCACLLVGAASSQEPPAEPAVLKYRTEIRPTGDARLDAALQAVSQLTQLQEQAPTGPIGVLGRARADRDRFARALQSEGYWGGTARVTVADLPLDAADLQERLEASGDRTVPVVVAVDKGQAYRVSEVSVRSVTPEGAAAVTAATEDLGLRVGDPARAEPVLAAERRLLDRLLASGHPLAVVAGRDTVVNHDRREMAVTWRLAPGPAARFAVPEVEGAERVDAGFLKRYAAGRLENEPYSPDRLERARRSVLALGPFASVRARAADRLDATGRLPTTFTVSERARHAIGLSAAYETNYGPSVRAYWEHRNLLGGAERLRVEAEVARIGTGGSIGEMTYRGGVTYRDPGLLGRDLTLVVSLFALRERLEAYDRDAITGTVLFEQRLSERLFVQAGPTADFGRSGPPDGRLTNYQIAGLTFGGRYDGTDSLLDPSQGWRLNGAVTPSWSFSTSAPFAPLRATGSTYWDVLGNRRSILAARGTLGSLLGAQLGDVPRHIRFYAGGGGSVRGYDYQSIGPRDERNRPSGGGSLVEASVEWRQRVWGDIGAVAFVDAGSVGSSSAPEFSNLRVGAGLGVRYHTPIGPIRADVAVPLVKQRDSSNFGLYVGIGQAF
ncbi:MAG: Outer membrane component of TAM transport system [uncultured Acetobacteraceae bacterium]|uniref:Outer membrane component of TAM transport system n=1 Tax=uncultured Acetobacteraceae bacterium TaxID=169975 RepID=A0A6J4IRE2_9PROT|nr:MAG: Outer membrane component of TAM transport system [uncultured Acetobacteraceae bacterium]